MEGDRKGAHWVRVAESQKDFGSQEAPPQKPFQGYAAGGSQRRLKLRRGEEAAETHQPQDGLGRA